MRWTMEQSHEEESQGSLGSACIFVFSQGTSEREWGKVCPRSCNGHGFWFGGLIISQATEIISESNRNLSRQRPSHTHVHIYTCTRVPRSTYNHTHTWGVCFIQLLVTIGGYVTSCSWSRNGNSLIETHPHPWACTCFPQPLTLPAAGGGDRIRVTSIRPLGWLCGQWNGRRNIEIQLSQEGSSQ